MVASEIQDRAERIEGQSMYQLSESMDSPCLNWQRNHSILGPPVAIKDGALAPLLVLELHVLIGGPDRHWHQIDRVIGDARSDPDQHSRAPDWREHHAVDRELLNAVEEDLALGGIPLPRLLLEQLVDVR